MNSRTWKRFEQQIAEIFGTTRKLMKGTDEVADIGGDDPNFPLVLDSKLRKREKWLTIQWFQKVEAAALEQNKWPVLVLREPGKIRKYALVRRTPLMKFISEKTKFDSSNFLSKTPVPKKTIPFTRYWDYLMKDFQKYRKEHRIGTLIPILFMTSLSAQIEFAILEPEALALIFREGGLLKDES